MKISRRCTKFWNKLREVGGKHLRALLIIAGIFGSLFFGHQLDANADDSDRYWLRLSATVRVIEVVNADGGGLSDFPYVLKTDNPECTLRLGYSRETSYPYYKYYWYSGLYDQQYTSTPIPEEGHLELIDSDYDVLESVGEVTSYGTPDATYKYEPAPRDIPHVQVIKSETLDWGAPVYVCSFPSYCEAYGENKQLNLSIGKKPTVTVKNRNGEDISSKFDINASFDFKSDDSGALIGYGHARYYLNSLNIKPKSDSGLPPLTGEKLNLKEGGSGSSYNSSDGTVTLTDYNGGNIIFETYNYSDMYFSSETNGQDTPWQNNVLPTYYSLEAQTDLSSVSGSIVTSDNFNKGAWKLVYDSLSVTEDHPLEASFRVKAEAEGFEFDESQLSVSGSGGVTIVGDPSLSGNNKNLDFGIKVSPSALNPETVTIGGQCYTQYTNTFKEAGGRSLNTYVRALTYQTGATSWGTSTWAGIHDLSDIGTDVWSLSDSYRTSNEKFNSNYRVWTAPGYYLGNATVKFDNQELTTSVDSLLDYIAFSVTDKELSDHTIVIDNVKKHYDVTFKPQDGTDVRTDINLDGFAWSTSIVSNLPLDDKFTVNLNVVNGHKIFIKDEDNTKIRDAIIAANTGLTGLECTRNGDTSITLAVPHNVSPREITIPDSILAWKIADVDFSIDVGGFVDNVYKDEALQSIKLYKVNNGIIDENNPIELREGNNSNLVNVVTQKNISYDNLTYAIKLSDNTYVDLSNAKVSIDGGVDGEAEAVSPPESNKFAFRLNPNADNAPYRGSVKFTITDLNTNLKRVSMALCAKANLYFKQSDGSFKNLVNAPADSPINYTAWVPAGGATYMVDYTDYSKELKETDITGSNVQLQDITLESYNKISFKVIPEEAATREVRISDPAKTAPPVKFTAVEGIKYYRVDAEHKIDHGSPIQGTINIPYEQPFSFAVECNEGYDPSTLELKANDNIFGSADGFTKESKDDYYVFTIDGSKAIYPITITGNIRAMQKNITFNKNLGSDLGNCDYIYNGASVTNVTVVYGQGITFEVTLPEKCNQSDIKVKFNDTELSKVNGRYVLNNVTSDGTVTVSNVSLNRYPVTFASNARATYKNKDESGLSGTIDVPHGGSLEFRVQPNPGYTMGENSVVYLRYADGRTTTLQPSNDVYKISNLTQSCTVSVENVEDIVYTITLAPTAGVTYLNDVDNVIKDYVKIKHGRNFEFSVSLSDEYDDSLGGMNIIVNDGRSSQSSAQKLASGRYVIPNVSEDLTIKVGNVRKNTYTVTLTGAEGIDYYDASGKVITGDNQAEHYSDFSFKVELYPAYVGSDITVMLGDTPMKPDSNGFYTISKISESKTVTVVGIEQNDESLLVNKINNLPDSLKDLGDVDDVIEATKAYEALSDSQKALIGNADKLKALQEQVKQFHHVSNDVRISGIDWYIKLYAIPITDDTDACGRIYKKLGSEYILSLYNVYLWDTLNDTRYTLPEGQSAVITLPTPDMTYFEKPTVIHEKDGGRIVFITPSINGETTTFETDSFSPMGIIASRSDTPGRSSLLDAADANLDAISNFAASVFGNETNRITRSGSDDGDYSDLSGDSDNDDISGNIDEKFRSRNNRVTATSSALRLILVLMILILMGLMIYFFIKRRKDNKKADKE